MRLSDESVIEGGHLTPEERIALQAEEIKQLWQENEQLRAKLEDWKHEVQCHMDEVIAREKQIEQLRAQVARMREVLEQFKYNCEQNYPIYQNYLAVCQLLREDTVQAYHNPADVEALRKAKEEIQKSLKNYELVGEHEYDISEHLQIALDEIDKAIGGKEDAGKK